NAASITARPMRSTAAGRGSDPSCPSCILRDLRENQGKRPAHGPETAYPKGSRPRTRREALTKTPRPSPTGAREVSIRPRLPRGQDHDHLAAFHARRILDLGDLVEVGLDLVEQLH